MKGYSFSVRTRDVITGDKRGREVLPHDEGREAGISGEQAERAVAEPTRLSARFFTLAGILQHQKQTMALQPNKPAPEFSGMAVENGQFKKIALSQYRGQYVVLFFYPLDL